MLYERSRVAISRIASGAVAATSDATPSCLEGDILIVFAYRAASATAPTIDASYTSINTNSNSAGGVNGSMICGYRVAGAGGFTGSGTWANASNLAWIQLRGQKRVNPIGNQASTGGNNAATSINYPAVNLTGGATGQWIVAFDGRTTGIAAVSTAPSGMTNHASNPVTPVVAVHSTNGVRTTNWPSTTVTDTSLKTNTSVIEVRSEDPVEHTDSFAAQTYEQMLSM
jgi:hypothetical protein